MKSFVLLIALVAVGLFVFGCLQQSPTHQFPTACTQEAKLCPDGSAVGRVLPDCDFGPCPSLNESGNNEPKTGEVHLNVPHSLQNNQPACIYVALHNILRYYNESISLEDFFGISGYYSSIVEEYFGIGWEKYHGKLYMLGGEILPELGYITYNQNILFAKDADNSAMILGALDKGIPLLFLPIHENLWYLDAVRSDKTKRGDPTIHDFEALDALTKPFFGHAVVITGYKYVSKDIFLEISDSGYESELGPYYYINLTNYFDFLDYVRSNQNKRTSFEDPLIENTLMYKVIKDPEARFKPSATDKDLYFLYRTIDSFYLSASHLEGKVFNENTGWRGAIAACGAVELMPKLADTFDSQLSIKDPELDQVKSMLDESPQLLGTCDELQGLATTDVEKLNARIQNITDRLYAITGKISDVVDRYGKEMIVKKENGKITITLAPKLDNLYGTDIRLSRGTFVTNVTLSNITLSSGTYELLYNSIIKVTDASYPLTVSFDAESGEEVPLLLIVESYQNVRGQGIYDEVGYRAISAKIMTFGD